MSAALDKVRRTSRALERAQLARDVAIRAAREADPPETVRAIAAAAGLSATRVFQIANGGRR